MLHDGAQAEQRKQLQEQVPLGGQEEQAAGSAAPAEPAPGVEASGPAWTRGELEAPAGEKDLGTSVQAVYTAEQQARLGVDEHGAKVEAEPEPAPGVEAAEAATEPATAAASEASLVPAATTRAQRLLDKLKQEEPVAV